MFTFGAAFPGQATLLTLCIVVGVVCVLLYLARRGGVAKGRYNAELAWYRAGIYFCVCGVVASYSGVAANILTTPVATTAQLGNPAWWALSIACLAVIIVGYGVIWPKGTFNEGRKLYPALVLAYGSIWGICQGLMFMSLWSLAELTGLSVWWVAGISYVLIGACNGLWHNFFWDKFVSPPHNYSEWNGRKVALCHTPNLIICLVWLALYGNVALYVLLQGLALAISAWVMRFPAPWDDYTAPAGQEK